MAGRQQNQQEILMAGHLTDLIDFLPAVQNMWDASKTTSSVRVTV